MTTVGSRTVTANGIRLHVRVAGEGKAGVPVLLLHGYPETSHTWRFALEALGGTLLCYAPDFRGWGESEKRGPYSLRGMVEDTVALMRALGHERYALVGHDWGAATAYLIARDHPEFVERLVTINMPVRKMVWWRPLHFYIFSMALVPELLMKFASDWVVKAIIRWWAHNHAAFPPDVLRVYQNAARQPGANAASRGYYRNTLRGMMLGRKRNLGMGPMADKPRRPAAPWLCVWGTRDWVSPMRNLDFFRADFPDVPVETIDHAGHFPQEEQPEAFNEVVRRFLTR